MQVTLVVSSCSSFRAWSLKHPTCFMWLLYPVWIQHRHVKQGQEYLIQNFIVLHNKYTLTKIQKTKYYGGFPWETTSGWTKIRPRSKLQSFVHIPHGPLSFIAAASFWIFDLFCVQCSWNHSQYLFEMGCKDTSIGNDMNFFYLSIYV